MGGPENGNFPLLYVVKMSLRRWVVQKSLKTLRNIIKLFIRSVTTNSYGYFFTFMIPGKICQF